MLYLARIRFTTLRHASAQPTRRRNAPHLVTVRLIVFKVTLQHCCDLSLFVHTYVHNYIQTSIYTYFCFSCSSFCQLFCYIFHFYMLHIYLYNLSASVFSNIFFLQIRAISASHRPLCATHTLTHIYIIALHCLVRHP